MPGYITPPVDSGNRGWLLDVKLTAPPPDHPTQHPINGGIDVVYNWMLMHGWTHGDSSATPGTKATSTLTFFGIPFHTGGPGGFSQVPGGGGAGEMGEFDTYIFVFWDPFSTMGGPTGHGDTDPTFLPSKVIGVMLGASANDTILNFLGKLAAFTHYTGTPNFNMITGEIISATIEASGDLGDPFPPYGPLFNDPQWAPSGANAAGSAPRMGGWYLLSSPEANTGDFMRLWIYEGSSGNAEVQVRFLDNPDYDCVAFPLKQSHFHFSCCPFQFTLQELSAQPSNSGDSFRLNTFYLASCLNVPLEFKDGITNASFASGDLQNQFQSKNNSAVLANGIFKTSWSEISGDVFGISFPLLDVGTTAIDVESSALKPVVIAPLVSMCIHDNAEGYIAGLLWDSYFTMRRYTYEQYAQDQHKPRYIAWIQDEETLHLTNATLWANAQEGAVIPP